MTDNELAAALRTAALLEGDFTLRSGRKSSYYLDKYLFETQPALLRALAKRFATYVTSEIDRIAGPELGAVALAAATALETDTPFLIVRNARKGGYGTGNLFEGAYNTGERILLIEDIVTSGGQAIEAVNALRDAGLTVARVVVAVDRQEGGMDALRETGNVEAEALFTAADLGVGV